MNGHGPTRRLAAAALLLLGFLALAPAPAGAAEESINLSELTRETQKMIQKDNQMSLLWWIPEEFWRLSLEQSAAGGERTSQFLEVLRPYIVLVAVDGKIGPMGGMTYRSEEDMRGALSVADARGNRFRPVGLMDVAPDAKNLTAIMKPVFANMAGPLGKNMHMVLFPAVDKEGKRIADAAARGSFTVFLGEREFRWRLPLGSVLPSRTCPSCGENHSGAYDYCPYDGTRLGGKKAANGKR